MYKVKNLCLPTKAYKKDFQQQKVYDAETKLHKKLRILIEPRSRLQRYLNKILEDLKDRIGITIASILLVPTTKPYSECGEDVFYLREDHHTKIVVLHELAHRILMNTKHRAKHDPIWCNLYLWLLSTYMAPKVGLEMAGRFCKENVRFIPS